MSSKSNSKQNKIALGPSGGKKAQKNPMKQQSFKTVAAPVAVAQKQTTGKPNIETRKNGVRIRHKELLLTLINSQNFAVRKSFALNPGLAESFPWFSFQAQCYEKYKIHSIWYESVTRCGTAQAGSIIIAPDMDSADAPPGDEQTACTYSGTVEDAPWKNIQCHLKKAALGGTRFIRTQALAPNLDIKTYDAANVHICVVGGDNDTDRLSKIWVHYDIELFIPQLPTNGPVTVGGSFYNGPNASNGNPFGNAVANANNAGISMDTGSNITLRDVGSYILTTTMGGFTSLSNAGSWSLVSGGTSYLNNFPVINGGGTSAAMKTEVTTTQANTKLTLLPLTSSIFGNVVHLDVGKLPLGAG